MHRLVIFILLSSFFGPIKSLAQYHHFDNLEVQVGFKNFKVDYGDLFFRRDTLLPEPSFIQGRNKIGSPNSITLLSIGYETELKNNLFLSTKTEFNLKGARGMGIQLGAGYRFHLNYFLRLQTELLFSWGMVSDTIGSTTYSPSPLLMNGIQFWPDAEVHAIYRGQQYGMQPKVTFVADFAKKFEFRFTMMYQVAFIYNQVFVFSGDLIPGQQGHFSVPFRDPYTVVQFNNAPPEKALYRPSGLSARMGFAYKVVR
ncbi:hypothetical protein GC194_02870 [bacterium]|nr:hypothetical protein [bacterium]